MKKPILLICSISPNQGSDFFVRLSELNWILSPATYLSERKGDDYVIRYTKPYCYWAWIWTRTISVKDWYAEPLHHSIMYSRQDSNLRPLRSRRSIQPTGMLLYFSKNFFKSVPAATAGSTLFLLLQLIFFIAAGVQQDATHHCCFLFLLSLYFFHWYCL